MYDMNVAKNNINELIKVSLYTEPYTLYCKL